MLLACACGSDSFVGAGDGGTQGADTGSTPLDAGPDAIAPPEDGGGGGGYCATGLGALAGFCMDWDEGSLTGAFSGGKRAADTPPPTTIGGNAVLDLNLKFSMPGSFLATTNDAAGNVATAAFIGPATVGAGVGGHFSARIHLNVAPMSGMGGSAHADLAVVHVKYTSGGTHDLTGALFVDDQGQPGISIEGSVVNRHTTSVSLPGGAWHSIDLVVKPGGANGAVTTFSLDGGMATSVTSDPTGASVSSGASCDFGVAAQSVGPVSVNYDNVALAIAL